MCRLCSPQAIPHISITRNGQLLSFNDADIDSIAFSKVDTNGIEQENVVTQIIYAGDSTYRISIAQVDSIAFSPRATQNDEHGITMGQEVDLGLPSGTIWAGWNVGATSPEEYGDYYAWGETEEKSYYDLFSYIDCIDSNEDGYKDSFVNIGSNISGTKYDVAHRKWGGSWRMPTKAEIDELSLKCTWVWTQYNGINGYKIIGINGNSIFLPAAGHRYESSLRLDGWVGRYWSATQYGELNFYRYSWVIMFSRTYIFRDNDLASFADRYFGYPVRPVK